MTSREILVTLRVGTDGHRVLDQLLKAGYCRNAEEVVNLALAHLDSRLRVLMSWLEEQEAGGIAHEQIEREFELER